MLRSLMRGFLCSYLVLLTVASLGCANPKTYLEARGLEVDYKYAIAGVYMIRPLWLYTMTPQENLEVQIGNIDHLRKSMHYARRQWWGPQAFINIRPEEFTEWEKSAGDDLVRKWDDKNGVVFHLLETELRMEYLQCLYLSYTNQFLWEFLPSNWPDYSREYLDTHLPRKWPPCVRETKGGDLEYREGWEDKLRSEFIHLKIAPSDYDWQTSRPGR